MSAVFTKDELQKLKLKALSATTVPGMNPCWPGACQVLVGIVDLLGDMVEDFPEEAEKTGQLDKFLTQDELIGIREWARVSSETLHLTPSWKRAYEALADAADHLDAKMARTEVGLEDDM